MSKALKFWEAFCSLFIQPISRIHDSSDMYDIICWGQINYYYDFTISELPILIFDSN